MAYIGTVRPEEAEGLVKEEYENALTAIVAKCKGRQLAAR